MAIILVWPREQAKSVDMEQHISKVNLRYGSVRKRLPIANMFIVNVHDDREMQLRDYCQDNELEFSVVERKIS